MTTSTKKVIASLVVAAGIVTAGVSIDLGNTKAVFVNSYSTSLITADPTVKAVSCTLGGTLVKNAQAQTVVQFSWTIPAGAIAYIYNDIHDVGYVPALSDTAAAQVLESAPVSQVSTYTMVVSDGAATSSCQTTI